MRASHHLFSALYSRVHGIEPQDDVAEVQHHPVRARWARLHDAKLVAAGGAHFV